MSLPRPDHFSAGPERGRRVHSDGSGSETTSSVRSGVDIFSSVPSRDQIYELVEAERSQIGHDIHDELIPLLFATRARASRMLADARDKRAPGQPHMDDQVAGLDQMVQWLDRSMDYCRHLISQIEIPSLDVMVWSEAVERRVRSLFDSAVQIQWRLDSVIAELSGTLAVTAYRITVEAIRNAVQHGKATSIEIVGRLAGAHASLSVRDNGRGFDPSDVAGDHFGLRIMKRRAEFVGGALEISSAPDTFTTVAFSFPLTA